MFTFLILFFSAVVMTFLANLWGRPWPYFSIVIVLLIWLITIHQSFTLREKIKQLGRMDFSEYVARTMAMYMAVGFLFSLVYLNCLMLTCKICDGKMSIYRSEAFLESWFNCFYFSIVTGMSLGYGDIVPKDTFARIISIGNISFGPLFFVGILTTVITLNPRVFDGRRQIGPLPSPPSSEDSRRHLGA